MRVISRKLCGFLLIFSTSFTLVSVLLLFLLSISLSAAANKFCELVQVGIDVYIPHRKYQVKPRSSP